jgi:hypothetical protein
MDPLFNVAQMRKPLNLDIWNYTTSKRKSLKIAYQALLPYISKEKDWEGEQIKPFEFQAAVPLLAQGITKYNCNECKESIKEILGEKFEKSVYNLIYSLD